MTDTEVRYAQQENERLKQQLLEAQQENDILRAASTGPREELKALKVKTQQELASLHNESNVQKKTIADYEAAHTKAEAAAKQYKTEAKKFKADLQKAHLALEELQDQIDSDADPTGKRVLIKEVAKEVIVEKIVERIVEKPVEIIKEVVVEKIVEKIVEKPVEVIREVIGESEEMKKRIEQVTEELLVKKLEVSAFRAKLKEIGEVMLKVSEAEFKPGV